MSCQPPTIMRDYFIELLRHAPWRLMHALALMLAVALLEGVGLSLLVPVLAVFGIGQATLPGWLAALTPWLTAGGEAALPLVLAAFVLLVSLQAWLQERCELALLVFRLDFVASLQQRLHAAMARASWASLATGHGSDYVHVLQGDIQRVATGTHFFLQALTVAFVGTAYVVVAAHLSAMLMICVLMALLAMTGIMRRDNRRVAASGRQLHELSRRGQHQLQELLGTLRLIKAHGGADQELALLQDRWRQQHELQITHQRQRGRTRTWYRLAAASLLVVLVYAAISFRLLGGAELLVLVAVVARLVPMLSQLQGGYQHVLHLLPAYQAWRQMLRYCQAHAESLADSAQAMRLTQGVAWREVRYAYAPTGFALVVPELWLPARQTTAIVGASGAGKSTLVDLLLGLLVPAEGGIHLDGRRLEGEVLAAWRQSIAYVPQEVQLFDASVRTNLSWGGTAAEDDAVWSVLDDVGLASRIRALPEGLDARIGERGRQLSGGERQRLALARALLRQPTCLVLDEATNALDAESERRAAEVLQRLVGRVTVIIIAHQPQTLRHADHVVVLEKGRVIATGSWADMPLAVRQYYDFSAVAEA